MNNRESKSEELNDIRLIYENAFGEAEGEVEAKLACDILKDETARPLLSLVAEENDKIVGNVIFSSVKVEGSKELSVYILAPLAVSKDHQKMGLGTKLIHYGLEVLKKRDADIILVLGDPNYYTRTGFQGGHNIEAPHKLEYPEAWMALELKSGMLEQAKGVALCASSLASPEHW